MRRTWPFISWVPCCCSGILRRTFLLPAMRERWGAAATPLAFVIALFWAIHPLQTESVTYIASGPSRSWDCSIC